MALLAPQQSFVCLWERQGEVLAAIRVRTEPDQLILDYRHRRGSEDWQDENYPVYLDWTTAHLGGKRTWFRCPADGCGQRVAILIWRRYLPLLSLLPLELSQPAGS